MTDVQPRPEVADEHAAGRTASRPPRGPLGAAPPFRVMDVEDVLLDLPSPYPAVTLVESEPPTRALVFPVGLPRAPPWRRPSARMDSRRPMTHELFMQVMHGRGST